MHHVRLLFVLMVLFGLGALALEAQQVTPAVSDEATDCTADAQAWYDSIDVSELFRMQTTALDKRNPPSIRLNAAQKVALGMAPPADPPDCAVSAFWHYAEAIIALRSAIVSSVDGDETASRSYFMQYSREIGYFRGYLAALGVTLEPTVGDYHILK